MLEILDGFDIVESITVAGERKRIFSRCENLSDLKLFLHYAEWLYVTRMGEKRIY
jgi:hypothetical protein